MINCLTISQYKDLTDSGQKALDLIGSIESHSKILNKNEYVSFSEARKQIDMSNSNKFNIDVCIQHMLNDKFVKTEYKNIGVFEPITKYSNRYATYLQFLDMIVVRSKMQKEILPESVKKKAKVVRPVSMDVSKIDPTKKIIAKFSFGCQLDNKIFDVLIPYFNAFTINDNVSLVVLGKSQDVINVVNQAKESLQLYKSTDLYPEVKIVDNLNLLLSSSHCMVEVSGTYDIKCSSIYSVKYGNPIITLRNNALLEWVPKDIFYIADSHQDYVKSHETCEFVHRFSLSEIMRKVVYDRKSFLEKQKSIQEEYCRSFEHREEDCIGGVICSL